MFGETESESPRMPSPWEALAARTSTSASPSPSPLVLASSATSTPSPDEGDEHRSKPTDAAGRSALSMKYLDQQLGMEEMIQADVNSETPFPKLAPEIEEGNVEYKLKLISPSPARFTRLVTQLKYRLLEGGGQALYEIGVSDSGELIGLSRKDLESSLDTLDRMAGELGATVVVLREIELPKGVGGQIDITQVALMKKQKVAQQNTRGGAWRMSDAAKGKKEKDREARRNRRAAALIVDDQSTIATSIMEPVPDSPSSELGADLSQTVTLLKPSATDLLATETQPMPIIKPYPYGRQPFALRNADSEQSLHSHRSHDASEGNLALASSVSSTDNFVLVPLSGSAEGLPDNRDSEDDDPAFGFNLDINSFASPPKPLHYSSFSSTPSLTVTVTDQHTPPIPLRSPQNGHRRKPIIPAAPRSDAMKKAANRRVKRDSKREERKTLEDGHMICVPEPISSDSNAHVAIDLTADPVEESENRTDPQPTPADDGPNIIAEALVVRKLALEEAFLDFGGFGLDTTDGTVSGQSTSGVDSDSSF